MRTNKKKEMYNLSKTARYIVEKVASCSKSSKSSVVEEAIIDGYSPKIPELRYEYLFLVNRYNRQLRSQTIGLFTKDDGIKQSEMEEAILRSIEIAKRFVCKENQVLTKTIKEYELECANRKRDIELWDAIAIISDLDTAVIDFVLKQELVKNV